MSVLPQPVASSDNSKRKGLTCVNTKDGKVNVSLSVSAVLSPTKLMFCTAMSVFIVVYAAAPFFGMQGMRNRVLQLEHQMSKKIHWVMEHKEHLQAHLGANTHRVDHSDGKRHLLTPVGGISKLAEAMAPNTGLADFDDHYLCGTEEATEGDVIRKTIAIAAISWMAPQSLRNSMNSWRSNGLLDIADEKMLFLNSPTDADIEIGKDFDFDIYTTDEHNGNVMVGPALAYLVGNSSADYILLMEKDFVLSAPRDVMMREMYVGVQHLARGVDAYRLRGNSDYPAEGMPNCCLPADPPTCPFHSNWRSAGYFGDHMNWLLVFCDPNIMENSNGRLARCTNEPNAPTSYCYGSGETNWSNNPVLFRRDWFHERLRNTSLMDFERNNMFEFNVMMEWLAWSPPAKVCMSYEGIFTHHEIDQ